MKRSLLLLALTGFLASSILCGYSYFYSNPEKTESADVEPLYYEISGLNSSSPLLVRRTNNTKHPVSYDGNILSGSNSYGGQICYEISYYFFVDYEKGNPNQTVTDENGNVFVKLRKFYVKLMPDSSAIRISHFKIDDSYQVNPYFIDENGDEVEFAYYGKYKGSVSNGKIYSKADGTALDNVSANTIKNYLNAWNNSSYFLTDWTATFTAQIMFMFIYGTTNYSLIFSNSKIKESGSSCATSSSSLVGICDFLGNGLEYVDGLSFEATNANSYSLYYETNIKNYTSSGAVSSNGTNVTLQDGTLEEDAHSFSYIKEMYIGSTITPELIFPTKTGGNSSEYYCDAMECNANKYNEKVATFWGMSGYEESSNENDYSSFDTQGLFYTKNCYSYDESAKGLSARLHAKSITLAS